MLFRSSLNSRSAAWSVMARTLPGSNVWAILPPSFLKTVPLPTRGRAEGPWLCFFILPQKPPGVNRKLRRPPVHPRCSLWVGASGCHASPAHDAWLPSVSGWKQPLMRLRFRALAPVHPRCSPRVGASWKNSWIICFSNVPFCGIMMSKLDSYAHLAYKR